MDRPYLEELRIQNYGCIRDATFKLTPLHALIGPNDSGKSTVLRAITGLGRAIQKSLTAEMGDSTFDLKAGEATWHFQPGNSVSEFNQPGIQPVDAMVEIHRALREVVLLRLDPDSLRMPTRLIQDGSAMRFFDERGQGLPALYDALIVRDVDGYIKLNKELARLHPTVKTIQLKNPTQSTKAMGVRLVDETLVPAERMSEGMLYYLAFAVLPYLAATPVLLVEEPENGLHPARIADVMRVLRGISQTTQVILATHSPLVINEMKPEEVTLVTRTPEAGTQARLMRDTKDFAERSEVFALGELWLSFANGSDESGLVPS